MPTRNSAERRTALIVGGGVVGLCCALNLQLKGFATTIVDPASVRRGASWGNAGHIAVEQVEPLASLATLKSFPRRLFWRGGALGLPLRDIGAWLPFTLRFIGAARPRRFAAGKAALAPILAQAIPAWRSLLAGAGAADLMIEDGHFVVWETPGTAARGRAAWMRADTGTARARDATADELSALAALTGKTPSGAIRFEGTARIADLGELAERLERRLADLGGRQVASGAERLLLRDGRSSLRLESGETLEADLIVIAAGVASGRLLGAIGHRAPIIAERGYNIQSAGSAWPADMPPVVFEDRSMIVTGFRSGLRAASFVEFGRLRSAADPRKWARLRSHVKALGLDFRLPGDPWMGARPTLPDYLPAIGRSARATNLLYAFGHQHLGLTLAAATGEAVAAMAMDEHTAFDLSPFDLRRFG